MTPGHSDLWFLPLGGCGEIGMNMNLYGHDDCWLMVDCGITFGEHPEVHSLESRQVQMADPAFIADRQENLAGIIITHGHEDHIGALPWLWPQLKVPVYTTAYTAEILRRKLVEHKLDDKVPVRVVNTGDRITIGNFTVEWIGHNHSLPEPCGLVIETRVGNIFHTADWKLDKDPVVGEPYDENVYRGLAHREITAMVCDSTCATVPGWTDSEQSVQQDLTSLIGAATGRVIVACFGSNIARLTTLAKIAATTNRHLGILGRSLINTVSVATTCGYWSSADTLVERSHLAYLPADTLLLVATGSQGEPHAALNRLSRGSFRDLQLEPGDTVIFSARKIPGNEKDIDALIERLIGMGVDVVTPESCNSHIHTSGHPSRDELTCMYEWVSPEICIPVHGEKEHLEAHVEVAAEAGVTRKLLGRNGDLYFLAPDKGIRRGVVSTGRLGIEQKKLVRLE